MMVRVRVNVEGKTAEKMVAIREVIFEQDGVFCVFQGFSRKCCATIRR